MTKTIKGWVIQSSINTTREAIPIHNTFGIEFQLPGKKKTTLQLDIEVNDTIGVTLLKELSESEVQISYTTKDLVPSNKGSKRKSLMLRG